jgi:glycerol-3-phosphate dehydrogenase subunit C
MKRPILFKDDGFYNLDDVKKELKRIFNICHGCRRCFNLCALFPKLFDILDQPDIDGDVDKLTDEHFRQIMPLCTLCDMCFMVKCPYVPPHPWNVDFPRVILRYKAIQAKKTSLSVPKQVTKQLACMDRCGPVATRMARPVNTMLGNTVVRRATAHVTGIDHRAQLPQFRKKALTRTWTDLEPNPQGHAYGEKVCVYMTCSMNYYETRIAEKVATLLALWGVKVTMTYPGCCGMPLLEQGYVQKVAQQATVLAPILNQHDCVVPLTPSCTLMLKSEWPSLHPDSADVDQLSKKTQDLSEYLLRIAKMKTDWPVVIPDNVAVHMACHVRAQNKGNPAYALLGLFAKGPIHLIERCSGHGGMWGYLKKHFDAALAVGKPVVNAAKKSTMLVSECPIAIQHLTQALQIAGQGHIPVMHPVELLVKGLVDGWDTSDLSAQCLSGVS